MAAGHGFLTATPDANYGDADFSQAANYATAMKFTLAANGTFEVSELGAYAQAIAAPANLRAAIFTHDATNDCPESMVPNSEVTITLTGSMEKQSGVISGTKPQLTSDGTTPFWLAILCDESFFVHAYATSGETERAATYPTWPTGAEWETHSHFSYDLALYAVYASTSQFARPSSDITDGNWLNQASSNVDLYASIDEVTPSDSDYIRSTTTPVDDTCTVGLSGISTPEAGTVTMRIRGRFL